MNVAVASSPLVLFYTSWYGIDPPSQKLGSIHWTRDVSRLPEAHVVVFHLPNLRRSTLLGLKKYPGQLWVSWTAESDQHYPLQADMEFRRLFDVSVGFDRHSTVWHTYMPSFAVWGERMSAPVPEKTQAAPAVLFQSAMSDRSGRNEYLKTLLAEMRVDSYGKFLNNKSLANDDDRSASKIQTIGSYHFCLAFENARQSDYVTERLFQPLLAGTVPVYRGAPNVADFAPPGSYINADHFSSPRDLAQHLLHLAATPEEYDRYFDWRRSPLPEHLQTMAKASTQPIFERLMAYGSEHFPMYQGPIARPYRPFGLWQYWNLRRRWRET